VPALVFDHQMHHPLRMRVGIGIHQNAVHYTENRRCRGAGDTRYKNRWRQMEDVPARTAESDA
jgi:hypothetical protein